MKKIILIVFVFLLTGCNPNHDFTKSCSKNENIENVVINVSYNHDDEITGVNIIKKYKTNDESVIKLLKESFDSFNNSLDDVLISEKESKNMYEIVYKVDPNKVSDKELNSLEIKKNSNKYFNYLSKNGFECVKKDVKVSLDS